MINRSIAAACAVCATLLATASSAQIVDKKSLSNNGARQMVEACLSFARKNNMSVAIVVVDEAGHLAAFERMEGVSYRAVEMAEAKAHTALLIRGPSKLVADKMGKGEYEQLAYGYTPAGGGLPVMLPNQKNTVLAALGAIGVSGVGAAGATADQTEQCAQAGVDAVIKP